MRPSASDAQTTMGELWKSDIEIEGDAQSQQDIRSMIYHLYSFVRQGSALSISPWDYPV